MSTSRADPPDWAGPPDWVDPPGGGPPEFGDGGATLNPAQLDYLMLRGSREDYKRVLQALRETGSITVVQATEQGRQ